MGPLRCTYLSTHGRPKPPTLRSIVDNFPIATTGVVVVVKLWFISQIDFPTYTPRLSLPKPEGGAVEV